MNRCQMPDQKMITRPTIILIALFLLGSLSLNAQNDDPHKGIVDAIAAGDFSKLATYFDAAIDLTLPQNSGNFSKKQAAVILKQFFEHNPPAEFIIQHEGLTNDNAVHLIGNYKSTNEKTFRTLILLKKLNGKHLIRQLQFE
jgi:hypothetical protein